MVNDLGNIFHDSLESLHRAGRLSTATIGQLPQFSARLFSPTGKSKASYTLAAPRSISSFASVQTGLKPMKDVGPCVPRRSNCTELVEMTLFKLTIRI
jgi:hypothetical protein